MFLTGRISILEEEKINQDFYFPIYSFFIIISYFYSIWYLKKLSDSDEQFIHFQIIPCHKGKNCKFNEKFRNHYFKRVYGRIVNFKEGKKILGKLVRKTDTIFAEKKYSSTKKFDDENSLCFICYERKSGFAYLPCKHTGICLKCGLTNLKPKNEISFFFGTKKPVCPLCRKKAEKVVFYEEDNEKMIPLELEDVRKKIGFSTKDFDDFIGYNKLFDPAEQH